jgi:hypothetical protein
MRVLHLPQNIASQITVTVNALRECGVHARGISIQHAIFSDRTVEFIPDFPNIAPWSNPIKWAKPHLKRTTHVLKAIMWADVVHWHYQPALLMALDLWTAKAFRKRVFVEFWGSDIRIPRIEAAQNPYYARLLQQGAFPHEDEARALRVQRRFSRINPTVFVPDVQMFSYIDRTLLPNIKLLERRVNLANYEPLYPNQNQSSPVIMHIPSAPIIKGSPAVSAAIDQLRPRHAFDYRSITGIKHAEAMKIMRECDIYIDQLVQGVFGLAAIEAMAFGKPVICYLSPSIRESLPEMPIIHATQETLPNVLETLILNPQLRNEIGKKSRNWVEIHNDAKKIATELIGMYGSGNNIKRQII